MEDEELYNHENLENHAAQRPEVAGDICRGNCVSAHSNVVNRVTVPGPWYELNIPRRYARSCCGDCLGIAASRVLLLQ